MNPDREPFVVPVHSAAPDHSGAAGNGEGTPAPQPRRPADAAAAYAQAAQPDPAQVAGSESDEDGAAAPAPAPAPEPEPAAAAPSPAPAPEHELAHDAGHEQVVADLEELTAKAAKAEEYLGIAQRTKADFENFRKRAARDAALAQERGIAKLAKELLPAVDNLERAFEAAATWGTPAPAPAEAEPDAEDTAANHEAQLLSGLKLVHQDVIAALARLGIEPFAPIGEPFDPTLHEAVAQTPIEGATPGTVAEVYQRGYRLGETVLRPARVLVAA